MSIQLNLKLDTEVVCYKNGVPVSGGSNILLRHFYNLSAGIDRNALQGSWTPHIRFGNNTAPETIDDTGVVTGTLYPLGHTGNTLQETPTHWISKAAFRTSFTHTGSDIVISDASVYPHPSSTKPITRYRLRDINNNPVSITLTDGDVFTIDYTFVYRVAKAGYPFSCNVVSEGLPSTVTGRLWPHYPISNGTAYSLLYDLANDTQLATDYVYMSHTQPTLDQIQNANFSPTNVSGVVSVGSGFVWDLAWVASRGKGRTFTIATDRLYTSGNNIRYMYLANSNMPNMLFLFDTAIVRPAESSISIPIFWRFAP